MKVPFNKLFRLLAVSLALALGARPSLATVAFNITPSAVSNTYQGPITLQVTGLNPGETVVVQKFLDADINGVIDANDLLVQQYNLTDGQATVINGVTNVNVPGDTDTVAGQITAKFNFQNGDFTQTIIGNFFYKLSSPSNHFTPLTNLFSVTNLAYAQKITGNLVNNGTNVPYGTVLLFPPPRQGHDLGNPLAGTLVTIAGAYSIAMPPGTYFPVPFRAGFLPNSASLPTLTLSNGVTITTNLTLTNATAIISGKLVDAATNSIGLPGVGVSASGNNTITTSFTDTNGNFSIGVTSGTWSVGELSQSLIVHGYVPGQNGTNVNAGTTNLVLTVPNGTALFYGTVTDNLGNPLPGISVEAQDNNSNYQQDGYTDTNGYYVAAALGGLGSNDLWQVQIDFGGATNFIYSQSALNQFGGTNLTAGNTVLQNFTGILATNFITGNVKYNGTNLVGVQVSTYSIATNGVSYSPNSVNTDTNGNYSLNVAAGSWSVFINGSGGTNSLDGLVGTNNYQCPGSQTVNITTTNGVANFSIGPCDGIQITSASPLPGGQAGNYYNFQFEGTSCSCNTFLNWSVVSGSLPSGLTLYASGPLNGTPGAGGTFNFTVQASDGNGHSTNKAFSLVISSNTGTYQIYGYVKDAGGNPITNIQVHVNGTNNLIGTTDTNGNYSVNVGNGMWDVSVDCAELSNRGFACPGDQQVTISGSNDVVNFSVSPCQALQITTDTYSVPDGMANFPYFYASNSFQFQNTGCNPPFTWSVAPGSLLLPPGLFLNTNGFISGTPSNSAIGTNYFSIRVTDAQTNFADQFFSLVVYPTAQITNASLPNGTNGVGYNVHLGWSGGSGSGFYGYSIVSGFLPPGLAIENGAGGNGVIAGVPNQTGSFSFTVGAEDDSGYSVQRGYSITINSLSGSPLQVTTSSLTKGTAGTAYSVQLQATGGTPPYGWNLALSSQPLPSGLILGTNGVLSGTPAAGGTNSFIVKVTDLNSLTATRILTLAISNGIVRPSIISPVRISSSVFEFEVSGVAGQTYSIQKASSSALTTTNWTTFLTTNPASSTFTVVDNNATNKSRFYRVLIGP